MRQFGTRQFGTFWAKPRTFLHFKKMAIRYIFRMNLKIRKILINYLFIFFSKKGQNAWLYFVVRVRNLAESCNSFNWRFFSFLNFFFDCVLLHNFIVNLFKITFFATVFIFFFQLKLSKIVEKFQLNYTATRVFEMPRYVCAFLRNHSELARRALYIVIESRQISLFLLNFSYKGYFSSAFFSNFQFLNNCSSFWFMKMKNALFQIDV